MGKVGVLALDSDDEDEVTVQQEEKKSFDRETNCKLRLINIVNRSDEFSNLDGEEKQYLFDYIKTLSKKVLNSIDCSNENLLKQFLYEKLKTIDKKIYSEIEYDKLNPSTGGLQANNELIKDLYKDKFKISDKEKILESKITSQEQFEIMKKIFTMYNNLDKNRDSLKKYKVDQDEILNLDLSFILNIFYLVFNDVCYLENDLYFRNNQELEFHITYKLDEKLITINENSYQKLINLLKKPDCKFIVIFLIIKWEKKAVGHANMLIIDKINKTVERFEPHGSYHQLEAEHPSYNMDKKILAILQSAFYDAGKLSEFDDYTYQTPVELDVKYGIQCLENQQKGYCFFFSLLYTEFRLSFPDVPKRHLINILKDEMSKFDVDDFMDLYSKHWIKVIYDMKTRCMPYNKYYIELKYLKTCMKIYKQDFLKEFYQV